jgi:hypothetical protein
MVVRQVLVSLFCLLPACHAEEGVFLEGKYQYFQASQATFVPYDFNNGTKMNFASNYWAPREWPDIEDSLQNFIPLFFDELPWCETGELPRPTALEIEFRPSVNIPCEKQQSGWLECEDPALLGYHHGYLLHQIQLTSGPSVKNTFFESLVEPLAEEEVLDDLNATTNHTYSFEYWKGAPWDTLITIPPEYDAFGCDLMIFNMSFGTNRSNGIFEATDVVLAGYLPDGYCDLKVYHPCNPSEICVVLDGSVFCQPVDDTTAMIRSAGEHRQLQGANITGEEEIWVIPPSCQAVENTSEPTASLADVSTSVLPTIIGGLSFSVLYVLFF